MGRRSVKLMQTSDAEVATGRQGTANKQGAPLPAKPEVRGTASILARQLEKAGALLHRRNRPAARLREFCFVPAAVAVPVTANPPACLPPALHASPAVPATSNLSVTFCSPVWLRWQFCVRLSGSICEVFANGTQKFSAITGSVISAVWPGLGEWVYTGRPTGRAVGVPWNCSWS